MLTFDNVLQSRASVITVSHTARASGIRMQASWFNDNQMTMFDWRRLAFGFVER